MFCNKCGKEIPDQAKFCNYCGAEMRSAQPQPAVQPQTAEPQATIPPQAAPKQKGTAGRRILTLIVAVIVFFAAKYIAENVITGKQNTNTNTNTNTSGIVEKDQRAMTESCVHGALYQDGYLYYGTTRLHMPGYFLLPGENGEQDLLVSSDETCMFAVNKQIELMGVSFDASTEAEMLQSYQQAYGDATMILYEKVYVQGYPVIRYIVRCTVDGIDEYIGEVIVFPGETTKETIRLTMYKLADSGYGEVEQVLDSLDIRPEYAPEADDTNVIGYTCITAR